jgi:hypothetical protein
MVRHDAFEFNGGPVWAPLNMRCRGTKRRSISWPASVAMSGMDYFVNRQTPRALERHGARSAHQMVSWEPKQFLRHRTAIHVVTSATHSPICSSAAPNVMNAYQLLLRRLQGRGATVLHRLAQ